MVTFTKQIRTNVNRMERRSWAGIIVLVLVAAMAVTVILLLRDGRFGDRNLPANYFRDAASNERDYPIRVPVLGEDGEAPAPEEPPVVMSYAGTITEHDRVASALTIATMWGEKTVQYNTQTVFSLTLSPSSEERLSLDRAEINELMQKQTPLDNADGLTEGDMVRAESAENIRGKTEFLASLIVLIQ